MSTVNILHPMVHYECNGVVFYYDCRPAYGEDVNIDKVTMLDCSKPTHCTPVICPNCGGFPNLYRIGPRP